jgi:hypothetical protein
MAITKIASKGQSLNEVLIPTKLVKRESCRPPDIAKERGNT